MERRLLSTVALYAFVPQDREPKMWGVPLVPWLPSASIAINIFLLGSIDRASFERFGMWTGALLIYYFFFGLHACYDTAKAAAEGKIGDGAPGPKAIEEGDVSMVTNKSTNGSKNAPVNPN